MEYEKFLYPIMIAGAVASVALFVKRNTPTDQYVKTSPVLSNAQVVPVTPMFTAPATSSTLANPNYLAYNQAPVNLSSIPPLPPDNGCCDDGCGGGPCNTGVRIVDGRGGCLNSELTLTGGGFDPTYLPWPTSA